MSYLILIAIGLILAVAWLMFAGALFQDHESGKGTFMLCLGVAFLSLCCSFLYYWNVGLVSKTWWGLPKDATYQVVSQVKMDFENRGDDRYLLTFRNADSGDYYTIITNGETRCADNGFKKIVGSCLTQYVIADVSSIKPVVSPANGLKSKDPTSADEAKKTKAESQATKEGKPK